MSASTRKQSTAPIKAAQLPGPAYYDHIRLESEGDGVANNIELAMFYVGDTPKGVTSIHTTVDNAHACLPLQDVKDALKPLIEERRKKQGI